MSDELREYFWTKHQIRLLVVGIFVLLGIGEGIFLLKWVPEMIAGLDTPAILQISALSSCLFIPFVVAETVIPLWWQFIPWAMVLGGTSGVISGYMRDTLVTSLIVGILSAVALSGARRLFPLRPIWGTFFLLAFISLTLNVWGHGLADKPWYWLLTLVGATLAGFGISALVTTWLIRWLNSSPHI